MTPEQLAKRVVDDYNIYQAQAWALGHASTSDELAKLLTVGMEKAVITTKRELVKRLLEIRDDAGGKVSDKLNDFINELLED
jgi:predicted RNA-binding Zn ribbon-like protein